MNAILHGKAIDYEILRCVDKGQESIVYKAEVQSTKRCVALKFRRKQSIDKFRKIELRIFQALDHLNIIKIFDYIEDLGSLRLEGMINNQYYVIDRQDYYCVVEDYVSGINLKADVSSSLFHFSMEKSPKKEASYEDVVSFQEDYLFRWIFEFCDIMSHMTKDKRILHLDIKPENIMVTTTGSIVLIDMGSARFLEEHSNALNLQFDEDHTHKDTWRVERKIEKIGDKEEIYITHGTPGFAAPECYYKDAEGSDQDARLRNPFSSGRATPKDGFVDIRSDIFSFGATLWDVIHQGGFGDNDQHKDYARISPVESKLSYFKRDLHYASPYYLKELEEIIIKCTQEDPDKRFQDYDELRKAAENAKKKLPKSEESSRRKKILRRAAEISAILAILFGLFFARGRSLSYEIAYEDFRDASALYSENTNPIDFRDQALILLTEAENANVNTYGIYQEILNSVDNNGKITSIEFSEILYKCLRNKSSNESISTEYIDRAMQNTGEGNDIMTISKFIASNYLGADCKGYDIAAAIANYNDDEVSSYNVLIQNQDDMEYNAALHYLASILLNKPAIANNDEYRAVVNDIKTKTEE
jgi:serine/threonine protein kinase